MQAANCQSGLEFDNFSDADRERKKLPMKVDTQFGPVLNLLADSKKADG